MGRSKKKLKAARRFSQEKFQIADPNTGQLTKFWVIKDNLSYPPYGVYIILWKNKREIGRQLSRPSFEDCVALKSSERRKISNDMILHEMKRNMANPEPMLFPHQIEALKRLKMPLLTTLANQAVEESIAELVTVY